MALTSNISNVDWLFNALDNSDIKEINKCLDNFPECVNECDEEQRFPLHYAADSADVETFQRILNLNLALINAQDSAGFTPLFVAVMAGNIENLEVLIANNAQLTHIDFDKHSAVHWAVVCAQLEALECLLKQNVSLEVADIHGARPLHYATVIENASVERVQAILNLLLKQDINVNCIDNDGRTPLLWAASNGNIEGFKSLIQAGVNKHFIDQDCLSVLHCAAYHGHSDIISLFLRLCLQNDNSVNAKDRNGDTPLFYASTYGHYECAKILLENGADANHIDKRCRSAAHCAASKSQLHIAKLLKQYHANFKLQNYRGDLPFHEAIQAGNKSLVEWLLQLDSNFIYASNFYGRTSLHLAAAAGNMELTVLLCTRGAEINSLMLYKNEFYTPLDLAKSRNHNFIVEYLTQQYNGLTANEISTDKQKISRLNIEKNLKAARLQRVQSQILQADENDENETFLSDRRSKYKRRDKLMLNNFAHNKTRSESFDSKRFRDVKSEQTSFYPKSTSTTGLNLIIGESNNYIISDVSSNSMDNSIKNNLVDQQLNFAIERKMVEMTIQKIVQEEIQKVKSVLNDNINDKKISLNKTFLDLQTNGDETRSLEKQSNIFDEIKTDNNTDDILLKKNQKEFVLDAQSSLDSINSSAASIKKNNKSLKTKTNESKKRVKLVDVNSVVINSSLSDNEKKTKSIFPLQLNNNKINNCNNKMQQSKENFNFNSFNDNNNSLIADSNINENDFQLQNNNKTLIYSGSINERRYVHEKAIFEELTHLKRMQIQYGRVQEQILVRSLISNFCKMHGLNTAHIRYQTFNDWEKFLYDQLKMIFLEERDRNNLISSRLDRENFSSKRISSMASLLTFNRFQKASPLDERLRELTKIYSNLTVSTSLPKYQRLLLRKKETSAQKKLQHLTCDNQKCIDHKNVDIKDTHRTNSENEFNGAKRCKCLSRHNINSVSRGSNLK